MDFKSLFASKEFLKTFQDTIEKEITGSKKENQIYSEIADLYIATLELLNVSDFKSFHFVDYEDSRKVIVDGKEYDFDRDFDHNNSTATEILCNIDFLLSDLEESNFEIFTKIEKIINDIKR